MASRANLTAGARDPSVFARHPSRRPHHLFRPRRARSGPSIAMTLAERHIVAFEGAQLGECSLARRRRVDHRGDQAGQAIRPRRRTRRWHRLAPDSVPAHRHPSAIPSARAGMDRILGRPCAAHAPRPPRRLAAWSASTSTPMTSSSSTKLSSAAPAISSSPSGRARWCAWTGRRAQMRTIAEFNAGTSRRIAPGPRCCATPTIPTSACS